MTIGRMVLLAVAIEVLAILVLVAIVALLGPGDPVAAQAYAQRLGDWVGPIAGFTLCLWGGWFVARRLTTNHVRRGLLLGALVAAIDVALLLAGGAAFRPLFAVSNLGRLLAGSLGGWLASRPGTQRGSVGPAP